MRKQLLRASGKQLLRASLVVCMQLAAVLSLGAQTRTAPTVNSVTTVQQQQPAPTAPAAPRTTADENFDLNIDQRRITESDFEASTSVEVGEEGARGLNLRVGVALSARSIDVLLRNVRGRVRFRASLEHLLQRIGERRPSQSPTQTTPTSTPP
ncbi:MAG TPA: hypothetical protein VGB73_20305 [Pyrinomonadaceae bacterium]